MLICHPSEFIEVRRLNARGEGGRGVFARKDIAPGTLLERAPVILIPSNEIFREPPAGANSLPLALYVFSWDRIADGFVALALGYASLYNHSFNPNAAYTPVAPDLIDFHATGAIRAEAEIFINYHGPMK